jgi:hypothetical protein
MTAQDTVRSLVLSEVYLSRADQSFVELTNMGDSALHLANFELGRLGPWTTPWNNDDNTRLRFSRIDPNLVLQPGESFVLASVRDWTEEQWAIDVAHWGYSENHNRNVTKKDMWKIADMQIHFPEDPAVPPDPTDSVSRIGTWNYYQVMETWGGRDTWYILYWLPNGDSVLIDQFNGIFVENDGTRIDGAMDVAGVTGASNNCVLVRKFSVKKGEPKFEKGRGNAIEESEWLPIPRLGGRLDPNDPAWEVNRGVFWTLGNHGDYHLSSLTSSTVDINWTDTVLTVPWGVRNDDSIMQEFNHTEGIAWHYDFVKKSEDSAYVSVRSGDVLTLYACGNTLERMKFRIEVTPPPDNANIVIPKRAKTNNPASRAYGFYRCGPIPYEVTDGLALDTISNVPYATRVDTLFKYLEKAPDADWEIVWVDGEERTDLKLGDMLKVTAKDGSEKLYYIKVYEYRESRNTALNAITWPDIPEIYKGNPYFGFEGDTIPNFDSRVFNYTVQVPYDVPNIPALVPHKASLNSTVAVKRATNLRGSAEERTTRFTVTAENDTVYQDYSVLLQKEVLPANVQPWIAEPMFSQIVWQDQFGNDFLEICNPGTEDIDLSNYMLVFCRFRDWPEAIQYFAVDTMYNYRYRKYIPGYKWVDSIAWLQNPGVAEKDLATPAVIKPGQVFVIGDIGVWGDSHYPWWASERCDIDLHHNPWHQYLARWTAMQEWKGMHYYMLKITNDSILDGSKPATDPEDFKVIEHWGTDVFDGTAWNVGPETDQGQVWTYIRKPEYYLPDSTKPTASWGTDWDNSQWYMRNEAWFTAHNYPWPSNRLSVCEDLGQHFMYERTHYKSTVSSTSYLVADGYKGNLKIKGVVTGTTVDGFKAKILKANEGQKLTLIAASNGNELTGSDVLANGDTLIVLSADTIIGNITKYLLEVTEGGLSDNALLTSSVYDIQALSDSTGTVGGMDYGTLLATVIDENNLTVPAGASFAIVDADDRPVPLKMLNYDTAYADVEVNDQIFFEVVSESGNVKILYQLKPNATSSDAFVTSIVYSVDQQKMEIKFVPPGTAYRAFIRNLVPAPGATMELIDKLGFTRTKGSVVMDDRLVVTSLDGSTKKVYYLSMLPPEGKKSDYLAYVLSDHYMVDQLARDISKMTDDITNQTLVFTFISNLIPAEDASVTVLNETGTPKTTGKMDLGDYLMVTAGNGVTVAYYTIEVTIGISTEDMAANRFSIYPNPSSDWIHISGLEIGHRIQIYSSTGVLLKDIPAHQSMESISLEKQANGIYFILIRDADSILGRYSLLKQ